MEGLGRCGHRSVVVAAAAGARAGRPFMVGFYGARKVVVAAAAGARAGSHPNGRADHPVRALLRHSVSHGRPAQAHFSRAARQAEVASVLGFRVAGMIARLQVDVGDQVRGRRPRRLPRSGRLGAAAARGRGVM